MQAWTTYVLSPLSVLSHFVNQNYALIKQNIRSFQSCLICVACCKQEIIKCTCSSSKTVAWRNQARIRQSDEQFSCHWLWFKVNQRSHGIKMLSVNYVDILEAYFSLILAAFITLLGQSCALLIGYLNVTFIAQHTVNQRISGLAFWQWLLSFSILFVGADDVLVHELHYSDHVLLLGLLSWEIFVIYWGWQNGELGRWYLLGHCKSVFNGTLEVCFTAYSTSSWAETRTSARILRR